MTYRRKRPRRDIEKRIRGLQLRLIKLEFEMSHPKTYGSGTLKAQYMTATREIKILSWVLMEDE